MPVLDKFIKYKFNISEKKKWINLNYTIDNQYININQKHLFTLRPYSKTIVECKCDSCQKHFKRRISKLQKLNNVNFTLCNECRLQYRYKHNDLEKAKRENTNLLKYGFENPMKNILVQQRCIATIKQKYGDQYNSTAQIPEIKQKQIESLCKNNLAPTSKQQKHIHNLIGGELNYPFYRCIIDIAFPNEKIAIEYDGSGHDLSVKLGKLTKKEFLLKEKKRNYFFINHNWKIIHLISKKDKLLNDNDLIKLINFSKSYVLNSNHHWINLYLEENIFECREFITKISKIIKG